ncbi:protein O-mannose kinase-like [Amphiura filiformis]|uniref:protein O-mannose kinase-like n=1 Tax=Amphiura filiformis TaxID=82378 RepID=UPI003B21AD72
MAIKYTFYFILIPAFTAIVLFIFRIQIPSDNHIPRMRGIHSSWIQEHETGYQFNDYDRHCRKGYFQLNNDGVCHPWLTCKDIQYNVTPIKRIGEGGIKKVYLASWKEYNVSLVRLHHKDWISQLLFSSQANNMQQFQPSPFVTQFLGFCPSFPALVTEYHRFGSLDNINRILKEQNEDNVATRFRISLDYVKIINFLHSSPTGTHVMCDSSNLNKTLSQFLVTSDLHVVVNDLDMLPVTPHMAHFDEKTDIWKIPAVVEYLMGNGFYGRHVVFMLSKLHQKCRSIDPKLRPTAAEVLKGYLDVQQRLKVILSNNS